MERDSKQKKLFYKVIRTNRKEKNMTQTLQRIIRRNTN